MGSQFDLGSNGSRDARLHDDFVKGLELFNGDDPQSALELFRKADQGAAIDDVFQNRYTSFHGLVMLILGDPRGVKLCRKAAVGEINDADVYCNLAMAEHQLGQRESAYNALCRGLELAPDHGRLQELESEFVLRKKSGMLGALARDSALNRWFGKMLRGSRQPYSNR